METGRLYHLCSFHSPHLFFLAADGSENIQSIEQTLQQLVRAGNKIIVESPANDKLYYIQDSDGVHKRASLLTSNIFWLVDYGSITTVDTVYELPDVCNFAPRCIIAGLNNIVECNIDVSVLFQLNLVPSATFSDGINRLVHNHLIEADKIYFKEEALINGIHFGQLHLQRKGHQRYNLTHRLIAEKIVVVNPDFFRKAISLDDMLSENNVSLEVKQVTPSKMDDEYLQEGVGRGCSLKSLRKTSSRPGIDQTQPQDDQSKNALLKILKGRGAKLKSVSPARDIDTISMSELISPKRTQEEESFDDIEFDTNASAAESHCVQPVKFNEEILNVGSQENVENFLQRMKEKSSSTPTGVTNKKRLSTPSMILQKLKQNVSSRSTSSMSAESLPDNTQSACIKQTDQSLTEPLGNQSVCSIENMSGQESDTKNTPKSIKEYDMTTSTDDCRSVTSGTSQNRIMKHSNIIKYLKERNAMRKKSESFDAQSDTTSETSTKSKQKIVKKPHKDDDVFFPAGMQIPHRKKQQPTKVALCKQKTNDINGKPISSGTNSSASSVSKKPSSASSFSSEGEIPKHSANSHEKGVLKLGCRCKNCKMWNVNNLDPVVPEIFEQKKFKKLIKPSPLLRRGNNDDDVPVIKSMDNTISTLPQSKKVSAPRILVHGACIPIPQKSTKDIPFVVQIHEALKYYKYESSTPLQAYGWPAIMRNLNLCLIGGHNSGKTLTYAPALCSFLLEKGSRYETLQKSNGPIAIILCHESQNAEKVHATISSLMSHVRGAENVNIAIATPPLDRSILVQFKTPCDMLITTPLTLIALLSKSIINLKRLCHLVIENIEKILVDFNNPFKTILGVCQEMLDHRTSSNQVQLIFTAHMWSSQLQNVMKSLYVLPLICISDHLQAALYGRADFSVMDHPANLKTEKLFEILKDMYRTYKTIVVCEKQEIKEIKDYFQLYGIGMVAADETMNGEDIVDVEKPWKFSRNGENIIMVCTDKVLKMHITITKATILVNYSLPDTWGAFCKRFSCLIDNYTSPFVPDKNSFNSKIYTFIDETDAEKFPRIANFFLKMGMKLPETFMQYCDNCIKKEEESKIVGEIKLCEDLKSFGKCSKERCYLRHTLSAELDVKPDLPKTGVLKYKILDVKQVNKFIIRLISCTDKDGNVQDIYDAFEDVKKYLADKTCLEFARKVEINEWYIVEVQNEMMRCVVNKIIDTEGASLMPHRVEIEGLDRGFCKPALAADLYEMPNELKEIPATCCELYIGNITPTNNDTNWSRRAKKHLILTLEKADYKQEGVFCSSNILLQIRKTFWVDDLTVQMHLPQVKRTINSFILKRYLQDRDLIDVNIDTLENLRKIFKEADIDVPEIPIEVKSEGSRLNQTPLQYAYLGEDGFSEVNFSCAVDPGQFYVKLIKYCQLFKYLQADMTEAVQEPFYRMLKESQVEIGKCYLLKDKVEDYYCRVLVIRFIEENVECFYVDYGDFATVAKSELKYLRDDFITKMPAQAIECRMYGISPPSESWDETATDVLYNSYCFEKGTDFFRTLHALNLKVSTGYLEKNARHDIMLVDYTSSNPIIINKILMDIGLAIEADGENLNIDLAPFEEQFSHQREDDEEDIDEFEALEEKVYYSHRELNEFAKTIDFDSKETEEVLSESDNENDSGFQVEVFDYLNFFKDYGFSQEAQTSPQFSPANLPAIKALPLSNKLSPDVIWYQTETDIKITIKVAPSSDTNYQIKVLNNRILDFSTTCNSKKYHLHLQLYERVHRICKHFVSGPSIKVALKKSKQIEWPRLVLSQARMHNIKYDLEKCNIEEEKKKRILDLGPDNKDEIIDDNEYIIEIGSDIDYSDGSDIEEDSDE